MEQQYKAELEINQLITNSLLEKGFKFDEAKLGAMEGTANVLRLIKYQLEKIEPASFYLQKG